jgi:predicted DNA-binding protein (MmcQ/YjbR family)
LPSVAGIIPAPYLARAKWVQARKGCGLSEDELRNYVAEAHRLVAAKLTRALRAELDLTAWLAGRQTP